MSFGGADRGPPIPRLGGPACCLVGQAHRVSRPGHTGRWLLLGSLMALGVCGRLWVQRALQGQAGGDGGWAQGRGRASREETEALQFGLVFMESALAPGWSGPAWPRLRRWAVTEDPGGGGQVGTWQYSRGGPAGGSTRAPRTARSSGWASAGLPGCLSGSEAGAA